MSSFLMGCYDPDSKKWCTVTKCSGGYDDATLARLQKELDVIKISKVREDPLREDCQGYRVIRSKNNPPACVCRSPVKSPAG